MNQTLARQSTTKTLALRTFGLADARCAVDVKLTTTERLARYETAQEIIGMMIALQSAWIAAELSKAVPDGTKVAAWETERSRLTGERQMLGMDDDAGIDRVLREYGPIVKATYAG